MAKKEWKKVFNLNTYEWWRNHRRVVTFGGFLILFAWYLSPVIQEARYKNKCIKSYSKIYLSKKRNLAKRIEESIPEVNKKDFADSLAYKTCTNDGGLFNKQKVVIE